jgi:hypothetical protein
MGLQVQQLQKLLQTYFGAMRHAPCGVDGNYIGALAVLEAVGACIFYF